MRHPPLGSAGLGVDGAAPAGPDRIALDPRHRDGWVHVVGLVLALGGILTGMLLLLAASAAAAGATPMDTPTASGSGAEPAEPVTSDGPVALGRLDTPRTPVSAAPDPLGSVAAPFGPVAGPITEPIVPIVAPIVEAIAPALGPLLERLAPAAGPIAEPIAPVVDPVVDAVAPTVCPLVAPVLESLTPACADAAQSEPAADPTAADGAVTSPGATAGLGSVSPGQDRSVTPTVDPVLLSAGGSPCQASPTAARGMFLPDGERDAPASQALATTALTTGASGGGAGQGIARLDDAAEAPSPFGPSAGQPLGGAVEPDRQPDVTPD